MLRSDSIKMDVVSVGDTELKGNVNQDDVHQVKVTLSPLFDNEDQLFFPEDDAWDASHAKDFLVGGPRCQVLITILDKLIANTVGAAFYSLDVMSPQQSLQFLTQHLERSLTEAEKPHAEELADEVGYLPLALELAAIKATDGIVWIE